MWEIAEVMLRNEQCGLRCMPTALTDRVVAAVVAAAAANNEGGGPSAVQYALFLRLLEKGVLCFLIRSVSPFGELLHQVLLHTVYYNNSSGSTDAEDQDNSCEKAREHSSNGLPSCAFNNER